MKTKLFGCYLLASFASASLGYFLVRAVLGGHVFGALSRMFVYHRQHPIQYIALACLVFSAVAVASTALIARLAVASIPGGMLWSVHDMQAGYFPSGALFWRALAWRASTGLQTGWLIIVLSVPYNALGLLTGYLTMITVLRLSGSAA